MAKITVIDEKIPNLDKPWAGVDSDGKEWGYDKARVEEFIKEQFSSKYGYTRAKFNEQTTFYELESFASEEKAVEYDSDPENNSALRLNVTVIPISTVQGDAYTAMLRTTISNTADIVVTDGKLEVPLNYRAVKITQIGNENAGYRGSVVVQTSTDGTSWNTAGTIENALPSSEPDDATTYTTIDIGRYLVNGRQMVRLRATYTYEEDGEKKTISSSNVIIGNSVTVTSLRLELRTEYYRPMSPTDVNGNVQPFSVTYGVFGSVKKTLYFKVDNGAEAKFEYDASVDSVNKTASISGANYLTHGVHKVEAWLEAEDGLGNTIKSESLINRFMMVADASNTKPYLLLQNVDGTIDNFVQTEIAQYAVYSPFEDEIDVAFLLTGYTTDYETTKPTEYFRLEQKVKPNSANTLLTTIEIEEDSDANIQQTYNTYFRVRRISGSTNTDFMKESTGESSYLVIVDNTLGMTPVQGATFLLNPKVRNNNEDDPLAIYNAKDGNKKVEVVWTNADLINGMWQQSSDGQKVLRLMAGTKLEIKKDLWAKFRKNPASSLTFEIDCKVSNVTNTTDPLIAMYSGTASSFRGLKMNALEGWLMTGTQQSADDTLFAWDEEVRTHFSININHQVYPNKGDVKYTDSEAGKANGSIALARVLVNGDCVREVKFDTTKADEWSTSDTGSIIIGNEGADIDIYSIRIYEDRQPEMVEILTRNYLSSLATSDEKTRLKNDNDILDGGLISFEKCKQKKLNSMVWHGVLPYHANPAEQTGWLEIERYDDFGNHLPDLSGTICKATKSLPVKGQGSTAKTYRDWNQQDDSSKVKYNFKSQINVILVDPKDIHESIVVSDPYEGVIDEDDTDKGGPYEGTIVDIYGGNLGKNFPLENKPRQYPVVNGKIMLPDGWIDGNGKYRGMGYMVAYGTALAQKRVIKINYASSMQSHLIGACKTYDLLHRKVVGDTPLQKEVPTAVSAKHTEPFMYFNQEGDGRVYFKGMGTYGAGKADKVAWGYVKKAMPMYALIEGSDNNLPMTGFRVPFDKNTAVYDCDGEGWLYNGQQSFDFDLGATETFSDDTQAGEGWQFVNTGSNDGEVPSKAIRDKWADIHNFIYLLSTNLKFFDGTFDQFKASAAAQDTQYKYWCTQGNEAFELKRYDFINKNWINAGLLLGDSYSSRSLDTEFESRDAYNSWVKEGTGDYEKLNNAFISEYVKYMKMYLHYFINEKSLQFNYCYVLGFLAGTDNSDKNTYYKIMPFAAAASDENNFAYFFKSRFGKDFDFSSVHQLYFDGDDMDSIFRTNNNSHLTKPYYIDRMHPYKDDNSANGSLYEGMGNQLFNFVERAYENTHELSSMMNNIMVAATELINEDDIKNGLVGGKSLWGFLNKYFFNIQRYFPKIAYLEQARIRYEFPELLDFISSGGGARSIRPITQSLGSQLEAEYQYMKQRVIYMTSYAGFGAWGGDTAHSIGLDDANETFSFMPANMPDGSGATYTFTVTPYQYIYPSYFLGQTFTQTHQRTSPKQTCTFTIAENLKDSGDTGMGICGVNYYTYLGNLGDKSITSAITISGKRLTRFNAAHDTNMKLFRPSSLGVKCQNVTYFYLSSWGNVGLNVDLSSLIRVVNIYGQVGVSSFVFPQTATLQTISISSSIKDLELSDVPNLRGLGFCNTPSAAVKTFYIGDNVATNTNFSFQSIVQGIYDAQHKSSTPNLTSIHIENIDWKDFPIETLEWYMDRPTCEFKGKIAIKETDNVRFETKRKMLRKFGEVDSESNPLYVTYSQRALTDFNLKGDTQTREVGEYLYEAIPDTIYANAFKRVDWSLIPNTTRATIDDDGVLTIDELYTEAEGTAVDVKCAITKLDGTVLEDTLHVRLFRRAPKVGDKLFTDASFDDTIDSQKTFCGVCFYVEDMGDYYDARFVAKENLTTGVTNPWGLYDDTANGITGVKLTDDESYDCYDTPVQNITSYGIPYAGSDMITTDKYCETIDGDVDYKLFASTEAAGYGVKNTAGAGTNAAGNYANYIGVDATEQIPQGQIDTVKIILHRNKLLEDSSMGIVPPTASGTLTEMYDLKAKVKALTDARGSVYAQFFYPSSSLCYAYQPSGTVADELKAHKWYNPSVGEMVRLCYLCYHLYPDSVDTTDGIFAEDIAAGRFTRMTASYFQSSSEYSRTVYWVVGFGSRYFYGYIKYDSHTVRPVVALKIKK